MGRTVPFIVPRESAAVPFIRQHVASIAARAREMRADDEG
jgi:hypothetical protein